MIVVLNKPYGYLSQFSEEPNSRWQTLSEFGMPQAIYPVGRLDADSEGLLVLTDEASVVSRLLEPSLKHPRTYWVQVENNVSEHTLQQLSQGVDIRGYRTLPCLARALLSPDIPERIPPIRFRLSIPTSWIELTLHEGKNRQVRRMTAAVGHPTLRLIRVGIGALALASLSLGTGQWKELSDSERGLLL